MLTLFNIGFNCELYSFIEFYINIFELYNFFRSQTLELCVITHNSISLDPHSFYIILYDICKSFRASHKRKNKAISKIDDLMCFSFVGKENVNFLFYFVDGSSVLSLVDSLNMNSTYIFPFHRVVVNKGTILA